MDESLYCEKSEKERWSGGNRGYFVDEEKGANGREIERMGRREGSERDGGETLRNKGNEEVNDVWLKRCS